MTKRRATFGKLQRERDKQAKAAAKRERRAARETDEDEVSDSASTAGEPMQAELLDALAALQEAYDDGRLGLVEYETRRDELRARIKVE